MLFHTSCKTFLITLLVLILAACNNNAGQAVKQANTTFSTPAGETPINTTRHPTSMTQQKNQNLLSNVQNLETQLLDANSFQPRLNSALEEITALQEQLKATESQLSAIEKYYFSTTEITQSITNTDDKLQALQNENNELRNNLSKFKSNLKILSLQYKASRQEIDLLNIEIAENQQIINSFNSKQLHQTSTPVIR